MKKKLSIVLLFCLTAHLTILTDQIALSKAYFATLKEMVERADSIAVANLGPLKEIKEKGGHWTYSKESQGTLIQSLKGTLPKTFIVRGGEDFICAQVRLVEGKCLLFLNKENNFFKGANWQNSCLPIKENNIHWYVDAEERFPTMDVSLDSAIKDVKDLMAGKTVQSKLPDYLKTLLRAKELADHIRGEAPADAPEWMAYTKACQQGGKIKKELLYLTKNATPAGQLYAACALMSCDNKLALELLGKMKDKKVQVMYRSGCRGTTASQGEIATSLAETGKYLNFTLASK